jgi:serine/threonine protein kinase
VSLAYPTPRLGKNPSIEFLKILRMSLSMQDRRALGKQLGNYKLIGLLGAGSFAEVFLGEHVLLNTQSAIKVLSTHLTGDEEERFLKEARTLARLAHPHIIRVLEFGVQEGTPFLVMEYAPNGTLRQRHSKGIPLSPQLILPYVRQVASALQYVHDQRLIHRDIKPENLLLGRDNQVLLSDFGVAVLVQSIRSEHIEDVVGTITYMAPEQIQAHAHQRSDQYALGVVIYEWLSGAPPFSGSFSEVAAKHMFAPPPPLHERFPSISPAVDEVILKALAKDPGDRFTSMRAFAEAFEEAVGELSQSVTEPNPAISAPVTAHRRSLVRFGGCMSSAGGAMAALAFILPWLLIVQTSCNGRVLSQKEVSASDFAIQSFAKNQLGVSFFAWLILALALALIIFGIVAIVRKPSTWLAGLHLFSSTLGVLDTCAMIILYPSAHLAAGHVQRLLSGFWLALTGFCLALSGSILINRAIRPSRKIARKEKTKEVGQHG